MFGVVFAVNSSLHSYLILAYSEGDDVSLDVGFYYSANATGRLVGTLLSGVLYLWGGLDAALWGSAVVRRDHLAAHPPTAACGVADPPMAPTPLSGHILIRDCRP